MVLLVILKLKVGDVEGMVSICIPYFLMEPIMDKLSSQQWFASTGKKSEEEDRGRIVRHMDRVKVPVALELGHTILSVADVMQLRLGDVIRMDEHVDSHIGVRVGNMVKYLAKPGTANGNFAAEIVRVLEEEEIQESEGGARHDG